MMYLQCKCGKEQAQTSGIAFPACVGCEECGTTLAANAATHQQLIKHDFRITYSINATTGERTKHTTCRRDWCRFTQSSTPLGDALNE